MSPPSGRSNAGVVVARRPIRRSDQRDREIKRASLQRRLDLAKSRGLAPNPARMLELRAESEKLAVADKATPRSGLFFTLAAVLAGLLIAAWLLWR